MTNAEMRKILKDTAKAFKARYDKLDRSESKEEFGERISVRAGDAPHIRVIKRKTKQFKITKPQQRILDILEKKGDRGATSEDLANIMGIHKSSVQPRTTELRDVGYVYASPIKRKGVAGRRVCVWRLAA